MIPVQRPCPLHERTGDGEEIYALNIEEDLRFRPSPRRASKVIS